MGYDPLVPVGLKRSYVTDRRGSDTRPRRPSRREWRRARASRPPSAARREQKGCSELTPGPANIAALIFSPESQVLFTVGNARSEREGFLLIISKSTHLAITLLCDNKTYFRCYKIRYRLRCTRWTPDVWRHIAKHMPRLARCSKYHNEYFGWTRAILCNVTVVYCAV